MPALLGRRYVRPVLFRNPAPAAASPTYNDTVTGTVALAGARTESHSKSEGTRSGTIPLSGTVTRTASHTATVTGTIPLSGTMAETFEPPGGVANTLRRFFGYGN